ncbi:SH3 domain-containing protein [Pseudotenacibaculum sp. MALMAid0570]|uniref:SH3 domain-containing protein n=1 Tax=Pseudotenacibaculum sp. MALMAid0570 TaxID=3143938 RepID=UPI0032E045E7
MNRILVLLLFVTQIVSAQSADELFKKANEQYKSEQYEEAIATYDQIESLGVISSELFYNLGNCYYKLNKVAPSIYNYEKALLINPLNDDAQNNLVFARRLTIDNIEELPKSVFQKIDESFVKKLSYNEWAIVSVSLSIIGAILFLLFYFAYTPSRKRLFFVTSMLCFLLLITASIFTVKEHSYSNNNVEAIIFVQQTEIKNAPTSNSENVFTLHEGTKVKVLDTVDNWKKIKIADGKIGWIISSDLKLLNFF